MDSADERPAEVELLAILFSIRGIAGLVVAGTIDWSLPYESGLALCCGPFALLGGLDLVVAYGLWHFAGWAWTAAIVIGSVGLVAFPLGAALGIAAMAPIGLLFVPAGVGIGIAALVLLVQPDVRLALGDTPWEVYGAAYDAHLRQAYPRLMRTRAEAAAALRRSALVTPANPVPTCGSCGARRRPGDAFCRDCGSKIQ